MTEDTCDGCEAAAKEDEIQVLVDRPGFTIRKDQFLEAWEKLDFSGEDERFETTSSTTVFRPRLDFGQVYALLKSLEVTGFANSPSDLSRRVFALRRGLLGMLGFGLSTGKADA